MLMSLMMLAAFSGVTTGGMTKSTSSTRASGRIASRQALRMAVAHTGPGQDRLRVLQPGGQVEQDAARPRYGAQDRRQQGSVPAAEIGDRREAAEVVRVDDLRRHLPGVLGHGTVERRRQLLVR